MQAENAAARRRFTLLEAIFLIAATAVAMLPTAGLWTEAGPVVQQLEVGHVLKPSYVKELYLISEYRP